MSRALTGLVALGIAGCAAGATDGAAPGTPATPDPEGVPAGEFSTTEVRVFTGDGEPATWAALEEAAARARIVLLGEIHDDAVGHRARHHLVDRLARGPECAKVIVSLEMLETDVQVVLDEYLEGLIPQEHFLRAARPPSAYEVRYRPYVERARRCGAPVVAANPPRRYVNRVARLGSGSLDALPDEARRWLPPLPVPPPSDAYRAEWDRLMGGAAAGHGQEGAADTAAAGHAHAETTGPIRDPMLEAQNLWDAGMAWSITRAAEAHPDAQIVHVVGSFHVEGGTGIPEHLARRLPGIEPLIVVAYPVEPGAPFDPVEHEGRGDFVILTER